MRLRRWFYLQLEPTARARPGLSPLNWLIVGAIVVATIHAVLQTEPLIHEPHHRLFKTLEIGFGFIFLAEYLLRVWSIVESPAHADGWRGRLRYMTTAAALFDLATVLFTLAPHVVGNLLALRLLRLFLILRIARFGRLGIAMRHLAKAFVARRFELGLTAILALFTMLAGATAMWIVEGEVQPDKFGSIPRALWWSAVTLTTIGYGDVTPITPLGKALATLLALSGIGLIAMPTGILAAAFSEALQRHHHGHVHHPHPLDFHHPVPEPPPGAPPPGAAAPPAAGTEGTTRRRPRAAGPAAPKRPRRRSGA